MKHLLLGNHPLIKKIRELITVVSNTAFNVLILGETGTGKEVVSRLLHEASGRRLGRFVKINCSAVPLTLLESEFFGYEKGSFTGAETYKPGKFELASDGIIFLDEIGDMPASLQTKFLQVLQSGEFTRLGGTEDVKVNAWIIAATNHNLEEDIKAGYFREDLYYRLNIIKVEIPPLRERIEDIPLLTEYFIRKHSSDFNLPAPFAVSSDIQRLFRNYDWPGNVRELSSVILKLMIGEDPADITSMLLAGMLSNGLTHPLDSKPDAASSNDYNEFINYNPGKVIPLKELKYEAAGYIERKLILYALNVSGWNKKKAAEKLQISYKTLFYKMDNLGISKIMGS